LDIALPQLTTSHCDGTMVGHEADTKLTTLVQVIDATQ
jgi:hypothetical protein